MEITRSLTSRRSLRVARELGLLRPTDPTTEGAAHLRATLEQLGTTFVKLGQLLASRPDLVGELYAEELSRLQDDSRPLPIAQIRTTIESELGRPLEQEFVELETEPLASASIAQTHAAMLRDGHDRVVVKVRRPGIEQEVCEDLAILDRLVRRVDSHVRAARLLQLRSISDELSFSLRRELDLRADAANGRLLAAALADFDRILVPAIHDELTSGSLLVMERLDGVRATDDRVAAMPVEVRHELACQLLRAYVRQLLVDGVYHADPHAGNILVRPDEGTLVVLDFGLVGRIDDDTRTDLTLVLLAMAENRASDMANQLLGMSTLDHRSDEQRFEAELRRLLPRYHHTGLSNIEVGTAIVQVQQLALSCGISLPIPFALIGKTLAQVDSIARALDPQIRPFDVIRETTVPLLAARMQELASPAAFVSSVAPRAMALLGLPERADRLLEGLERGSTSISITPRLEEAVGELRTITNRLATAIVLAAIIVASALLMGVEGVGELFGYPTLGFLGFVAASLMGLVLVVRMLRSEGGL